MGNLLVIAPLKREFEALSAMFKARGFSAETKSVGKLPVIVFREINTTLSLGGTGKVQFALHTQYLLERLSGVDLVACSGVGGGLVKDVSVGDVVIASKTIEHDFKERFEKVPLPCFPGAADIVASLKSPFPEEDFRVHVGPIASGDEDIVSPERAKELHRSTKAIAVAWEGAGGARAAKFHEIPYLEIRGITDNANESAPSDFLANLKLAMDNVGQIIAKLQGAPRPQNSQTGKTLRKRTSAPTT